VRFFLEKFRNGDADDTAFRSALIDTFVNSVYLYDGDNKDNGRVEIVCNANNRNINRPLDRPAVGSPKGQLMDPKGLEPSTSTLRTKSRVFSIV
jgi:hypothetical protein